MFKQYQNTISIVKWAILQMSWSRASYSFFVSLNILRNTPPCCLLRAFEGGRTQDFSLSDPDMKPYINFRKMQSTACEHSRHHCSMMGQTGTFTIWPCSDLNRKWTPDSGFVVVDGLFVYILDHFRWFLCHFWLVIFTEVRHIYRLLLHRFHFFFFS